MKWVILAFAIVYSFYVLILLFAYAPYKEIFARPRYNDSKAVRSNRISFLFGFIGCDLVRLVGIWVTISYN